MASRGEEASAAVRIRVLKRDRFRCTYCGNPGTDVELEVDHIIPKSAGGSNHVSNLTTACRLCNQRKGADKSGRWISETGVVSDGGVDHVADAPPDFQGDVEAAIDAAAYAAGASIAERCSAIASLGPVVARVSNPVEVELYVERIAVRFGVRDIGAVRKVLRDGARGVAPKQDAKPPRLQAELVGALLDQPQLLGSSEAADLEHLLVDDALKEVLGLLRRSKSVDVKPFYRQAVQGKHMSQSKWAARWLSERLACEVYATEAQAADVLKSGKRLLQKQWLDAELPKLAIRVTKARRAGDDALAIALTKERDELLHGKIEDPFRWRRLLPRGEA